MSVSISIELTAEAQIMMRSLATLPKRLLVAVQQAMNQQNLYTVSHIQRRYLSYPKKGPSQADGLRFQSGRYRMSLRASPAVVDGQTVVSEIGTNAKSSSGFSYPRLHEFGGTVQMPARKGVVRLRTNRSGVLLRQANGKLAIFAKKTMKSVKEVAFEGKAYTVTYAERMPIRRGITDQADEYMRVISERIVEALSV